MLKKYAVIGNPIAHSKSPQIHAAFAAQFDIDLSYERILAPVDGFKATAEAFVREGGLGANITLPFKQEAWSLVSERSKRAEKAGAVNTIIFRGENNWFGDNTDGVGLLRDLKQNHHVVLQHKKVLILGAGGATRGIIESLLSENPESLMIANRTIENAKKLANDFSDFGNISACSLNDIFIGQKFDVILNATSAGLKGEPLSLPKELFRDIICYDLAYANAAELFLAEAKGNGAKKCSDGLGMLVEQAAEGFYLWHGKHPDTAPVISLLRDQSKT